MSTTPSLDLLPSQSGSLQPAVTRRGRRSRSPGTYSTSPGIVFRPRCMVDQVTQKTSITTDQSQGHFYLLLDDYVSSYKTCYSRTNEYTVIKILLIMYKSDYENVSKTSRSSTVIIENVSQYPMTNIGMYLINMYRNSHK